MSTDICGILNNSKTIAVVGISSKLGRTSRAIAEFLVQKGYNVVGVNPNKAFTDADGIKVYNSLSEIPHKIDIIDVFRKSDDIPSLVDEIISVKPDVLWLQLGIRNDYAAERIQNEGISVIQDKCIKIEYNFCN